MAAKHHLFSVPDAAARAARPQELVSSSDDFSVKVSSPADSRFWVRVERDLNQGTLVVTDFNKGDLDIEDVEDGLVMAVRQLERADIRALQFRDIVPGGDQTPNFPAEIVRGADLVKRLGKVVAADLQTDVKAFDLQPRRGKIDGLLTLGR